MLQSQEFQVWDWKHRDITLNNLQKSLTNGMDEDVNITFKMYEGNVVPIDKCEMVYVQ